MKRKYVQAMMTGMTAMLAVTVPVTTVAAPSGADIEAVRVIKKIFKPLDLTLLDSLIISDDSAYSMANHNKFAYLFDY